MQLTNTGLFCPRGWECTDWKKAKNVGICLRKSKFHEEQQKAQSRFSLLTVQLWQKESTETSF